MSKYYNAESVNDEIVRVLEQTDCKDEYIDRVLRAIESLPTIEVSEEELKGCDKVDKRFSEDTISRKWVLDKLNEQYKLNRFREHDDMANNGISQAESIVEQAPSVIPQPKEGEWIDTGKDPKHEHPLTARWYRCSECGHEGNTKFPWCPYCGSRMKGTEDET